MFSIEPSDNLGETWALQYPPIGAGGEGRVISSTGTVGTETQTEWVYPYGHDRVRQVTPFATTDADDMDDPGALVDSIDTDGFAGGTYLITAVAKANYSQVTSDYLFGLYDLSLIHI